MLTPTILDGAGVALRPQQEAHDSARRDDKAERGTLIDFVCFLFLFSFSHFFAHFHTHTLTHISFHFSSINPCHLRNLTGGGRATEEAKEGD